ncbi:hypothetical protein ACFPOE_09470 [Caenimonas terrae]|uniref:Uncharacterized protein n=1 Tax=Caenimonas terrae TaxID=696074 RepID=A0ABW0NFL1_9BURK
MIRPSICLLLALATGLAHASEQVVTLVQGSPPTKVPISFLSAADWEEQGYVRVRVQVDNANGQTCISPTATHGFDNLFFDNKLDVAITARVVGFSNVDSSRDIPIAVYNWNGTNYCKSAFQPAIVLVPYTPLRSTQDPGALVGEQPGIVVSVKSLAQSKQQLTTYAQVALALSSDLATGGAATTVAGLTKYGTAPGLKSLLDALSTNSVTEQTLPIRLLWTDIVTGLPSVSVILKRAETRRYTAPGDYIPRRERVDEAIARIRSDSSQGDELLTMTFNFEVRRSVLVDRGQLDPHSMLPKPNTTETQVDNVLNFPKKGVSDAIAGLTVNQLLNAASPSSLAQTTSQANRSSGCSKLFNDLKAAFAVKVDVPVLFDAALQSVQRDWNQQPNFYTPCLKPEIKAGIETYQGQSYFPNMVVQRETELALNQGAVWNNYYEEYLEDFKDALLSSDRGADKFKALIPDGTVLPEWPKSLPTPNPAPTSGSQFFADLAPVKVGCIFGFVDTRGKYTIAMTMVTRNEKGNNHPYILVVRPGSGAGGPSTLHAPIEWMAVRDLDETKNIGYAGLLLQSTFDDHSICGNPSGKPRSAEDLLASLRS